MATFLLTHSHADRECASAFAAWHGSASPLRGSIGWAGCIHGDHRVFIRVSAASPEEALSLLPEFFAARTTATPVRPVRLP